METPIKEVISYLKEHHYIELALIIEDEFLEKEKQVIIDAYKSGIEEKITRDNAHFANPHNAISGEQYHHETFEL